MSKNGKSKRSRAAEIRRRYEQRSLERKFERTGIPVAELKKPKHKAKSKKK